VLATDTADADGNASFADFVIPADIGAGADRRFLVRHADSGLQDFSDPFTLLPTASAPARLSLRLGMGLYPLLRRAVQKMSRRSTLYTSGG
jgi:hypothetical protein